MFTVTWNKPIASAFFVWNRVDVQSFSVEIFFCYGRPCDFSIGLETSPFSFIAEYIKHKTKVTQFHSTLTANLISNDDVRPEDTFSSRERFFV